MKKILLTFFFLLFTSACMHVNKKIDKLPIRSTKIKVIKALGMPYKIERKSGLDWWVYKVIIEERHYIRYIVFKKGVLYRKSPLKPVSLTKF